MSHVSTRADGCMNQLGLIYSNHVAIKQWLWFWNPGLKPLKHTSVSHFSHNCNVYAMQIALDLIHFPICVCGKVKTFKHVYGFIATAHAPPANLHSDFGSMLLHLNLNSYRPGVTAIIRGLHTTEVLCLWPRHPLFTQNCYSPSLLICLCWRTGWFR